MLEPNFQIKDEQETSSYGKYIIEPLASGYGHTLGNALRRTLLTCLKGVAVTEVKIAGVKHQFSSVYGLKEDIVEFVSNLKKIRLKYEGKGKAKMKLSVTGPKKVTAGDIIASPEIKITNKDQYLGSLSDKKSRLSVEMVVESGFGYSPADERKNNKIGVIPISAIFTPITRVNYKVEAMRVGRMTDLDRLIIEIWTDGTVKPKEALKEAAKTLISYFLQIEKPKKPVAKEKRGEIPAITDEVLKMSVEELELPTRVTNALLNSEIDIVEKILQSKKEGLTKVKNLGVKSIALIEKKLNKKGISY